MGKSTINGHFSIAMLNYQRVYLLIYTHNKLLQGYTAKKTSILQLAMENCSKEIDKHDGLPIKTMIVHSFVE